MADESVNISLFTGAAKEALARKAARDESCNAEERSAFAKLLRYKHEGGSEASSESPAARGSASAELVGETRPTTPHKGLPMSSFRVKSSWCAAPPSPTNSPSSPPSSSNDDDEVDSNNGSLTPRSERDPPAPVPTPTYMVSGVPHARYPRVRSPNVGAPLEPSSADRRSALIRASKSEAPVGGPRPKSRAPLVGDLVPTPKQTTKVVRFDLQAAASSSKPEGAEPNKRASSSFSWDGACPDTVQIPIRLDEVQYFVCPNTQKSKINRVAAPIPLPHPDLVFQGYVFTKDKTAVSARFVKRDLPKGHQGRRLPRESGGVNKAYFDGLTACRGDTERKRHKEDTVHLRFGKMDPEI